LDPAVSQRMGKAAKRGCTEARNEKFTPAIFVVHGCYICRGNMRNPVQRASAIAKDAESAGAGRNRTGALLQQHEREFRESLASLSERVNELKEEVAELHSSSIFSVKIYKQSSEIERLAKQLKNLAKS
jgi:hypothetical protein